MKIGILTLPLHTNYGGILQAYALQTILERMGHEAIVLGKKNHAQLPPLWKMPLSYSKRLIKKFILGEKSIRIFHEQWYNKTYPIVSQYTQKFIDKYINYVTPGDLSSLNPNDFDAIVVGSDQIWRPIYYRKIENAFLAFAEEWKIKRIAYAASFGTDQWEYTSDQTEKCKNLVKKFDAVSVRESAAVNLCKEHFGINALHVLDPTMLLNKNDYISLFEASQTPKSPGNLLVYILDETHEKAELVDKIAKEKGLIPFMVNSLVDNQYAPLEKRIQPPIENWLRGFYDAEFVITDSFHACVFSIIFGKPFIAYGNARRGLSRFNSLLKMFSLEDRLTTSSKINQLNDIDWNVVEKKLNDLRIESFIFLKNNCNHPKLAY